MFFLGSVDQRTKVDFGVERPSVFMDRGQQKFVRMKVCRNDESIFN